MKKNEQNNCINKKLLILNMLRIHNEVFSYIENKLVINIPIEVFYNKLNGSSRNRTNKQWFFKEIITNKQL